MVKKSADNKDRFVKKRFFTSSARVGFSHLLTHLMFTKDEMILLPAYIGYTDREGSGVFDPISENHIKYDFYKINIDLSPDENDFIEKIKTRKFKAVLLIHYFGIVQADVLRVKEICNRFNVLLIEDCAHALIGQTNGVNIGSIGDFSFFSLHKTLAVNEGGILQINNFNFEIPDLNSYEKRADYETLVFYCNSEIPLIAQKRLKNYEYCLNSFKDIKGIKIMYPRLPDGNIPQSFPVIIERNLREKLYFNLINNNIPTIALYYRLIDEIPLKNYPNSQYLSKNILNLPIHQDTDKDDIELIANEIKNYLNNLHDA